MAVRFSGCLIQAELQIEFPSYTYPQGLAKASAALPSGFLASD